MTDKELLELAAKAAGIDFIGWDAFRDGFAAFDAELDVNYDWNPLTDDGDALRLAVTLSLFTGADFYHFRSIERFAGQDADEYTATRRAIVRAAAAAPWTRTRPDWS